MAKQTILNGTFDNDPSAEKIRLAFGKVNANFSEIYTTIPNIDPSTLAGQAGKIIVVNPAGTAFILASAPGGGDMLGANNLSELTDDSIARNNLGLGTAAIASSTAFATAAQGAKADIALQSVQAGTGISIDITDPLNPVITNDETDTTVTGFEITSALNLRITLTGDVTIDIALGPYLSPTVDGFSLRKYTGNNNFAIVEDNDKIEGWEDFGAKDVWLEGTVLDSTDFILPDDLRDPAKFFITNEKINI